MTETFPETYYALEGGLRINLGCGAKRRAGYLGVDRGSHPEVDVQMDVLDFVDALPASSVQAVYSRHFLEHLDPESLNRLLRGLDRILKPGGRMHFIVPHHSNPYFYADPTHRQAFGVHTFCYLCESHPLMRRIPRYAAMPGWHLRRVRVRFLPMARPRLFGLRLPMLSDLLNPLVNLRHGLIEAFERYLAGVLSIYEVSYEVEKATAEASTR